MQEGRKLPLLARIILWTIIIFLGITLLNTLGRALKARPVRIGDLITALLVQSFLVFVTWNVKKIKPWALRVFNIWIALVVLSMAVILLSPQLSILGMPPIGIWVIIILHLALFLYFNFGAVKRCFIEAKEEELKNVNPG